MTRLTLLGTGTPTNPHRFQTSALLEVGAAKLLFDAGRGTVHQLYQAGVDLSQIGPVFITHHHFDHINDLFDVIISTAMQGREETLHVYGPAGTQIIVDALLNIVYANDIRFRLEEDLEVRRRGRSWNERPEAIRDVVVHEVGQGVVASGPDWQVSSDFVRHGVFPKAPDFAWHCLGYRVETPNGTITISGDTVPCPGILNLAREADLLVQCCHLPLSALTNPTRQYLTETILPTTAQAGQIAAETQAKHLVLTHLSPLISEAGEATVRAEVARHYQGPVTLAEDLLALELGPNGVTVIR
ncbi:MAG: MBL fold metallo-hydrolase [Anaerolineales bacterium]|nr:MBL fold metallo-hydrolase [Anaerolineales bacterium]MCB0010327.1 MBL fold metallo-hydrolase [Anaerolineales bacterium]